MSSDRFLHKTSISNLRLSCGDTITGGWFKKITVGIGEIFGKHLYIDWKWPHTGGREKIHYLEVMFLMQLSKNIHDGHGPGVLGSEDLQRRDAQVG